MAKAEKNKGGRPLKEIRKDEFEKLLAMQCTLEEISGFFECHEDTIRNFCKREYGEGFAEVQKAKSAKGKISLRRTQFKIAESGNATMAIWLGKQYLGQRDQQEVSLSDTSVVFNIKPASDMTEEARQQITEG